MSNARGHRRCLSLNLEDLLSLLRHTRFCGIRHLSVSLEPGNDILYITTDLAVALSVTSEGNYLLQYRRW